ncbi:hypothetical protein JSY14_03300 [Brachybacterium sp. EF45031]|uniref:hypothetical protein n=1 Tax=Brachybacterium sillae TaxID=2810536 RepID=UPI00217D3646|nr:hypothetical protein [Brachybacterium sillae]MCS6711088.1 hypothetical protein [Brachybacterium sillae]
MASSITVEYCGEWYRVDPGDELVIGRDADLSIDADNQFLHRRFLTVVQVESMWWLVNIGSRLSATVTDADGTMQAWLAPEARIPLVFPETRVVFTAGPTTYDLAIHAESAQFQPIPSEDQPAGDSTVGAVPLTLSQKLLILALAEPMLLREGTGMSAVPTSAQAAERLGWPRTKFNRKLDNVCDKLDRMGVRGLRGGPGKLASNRRARLVEHAVFSRLVTAEDLPLLDSSAQENDDD